MRTLEAEKVNKKYQGGAQENQKNFGIDIDSSKIQKAF